MNDKILYGQCFLTYFLNEIYPFYDFSMFVYIFLLFSLIVNIFILNTCQCS